MSYADDCYLVYKRTGRMAHLLAPWECPSSDMAQALCRISATEASPWLGTGFQHEWERAERLPLCVRCLTAAGTACRNAPLRVVMEEQEEAA